MSRLLTIIGCLVFFSACQNEKTTISTSLKKETTVEMLKNATFEFSYDNDFFAQSPIDEGKNIVLIYRNEDITFVDATDYEAKYKEVLLFEINPINEYLEFSDEEIEKIKCIYSWKVFSKNPVKTTKKINKGFIKIKKLDEDIWEILLNIDTDHKFGGYIEKQNSRKIEIKKKVKVKNLY